MVKTALLSLDSVWNIILFHDDNQNIQTLKQSEIEGLILELDMFRELSVTFDKSELNDEILVVLSRFYMNISMLNNEFIKEYIDHHHKKLFERILRKQHFVYCKELLFAISNFVLIEELRMIFLDFEFLEIIRSFFNSNL